MSLSAQDVYDAVKSQENHDPYVGYLGADDSRAFVNGWVDFEALAKALNEKVEANAERDEMARR